MMLGVEDSMFVVRTLAEKGYDAGSRLDPHFAGYSDLEAIAYSWSVRRRRRNFMPGRNLDQEAGEEHEPFGARSIIDTVDLHQ